MAREDFRRGMLYGFAASGLSPSEIGDLLLKAAEAQEKKASVLDGAASGAMLGAGATNLATGLAVGVPLFTGVLGGAASYGLFGPDYKADINALRTQDVINEIKQRRRDIMRSLANSKRMNAKTMAKG